MWRKSADVKPSPDSSVGPAQSFVRSEIPQSHATPISSPDVAPAPAARNASKISAGLKINGELSGDADVYIDGSVQGKIRLSDARVTVGPNGNVQAEIEAREIVVQGSVQGNMKAGEKAQLGASSRVVGNILAPRLGIDDGARVRGKAETTPPKKARESSVSSPTPDSEDNQPVAASLKSE